MLSNLSGVACGSLGAVTTSVALTEGQAALLAAETDETLEAFHSYFRFFS
jgi:hypothetical protein